MYSNYLKSSCTSKILKLLFTIFVVVYENKFLKLPVFFLAPLSLSRVCVRLCVHTQSLFIYLALSKVVNNCAPRDFSTKEIVS